MSELPPAAAALVPSGNARLFALAYPRSGAETVILLHGGPGVPMDFSPIVAVLFRKYQVITFDQRGTGRSPAVGASYSVDEYRQDLDAIARHFDAATFHLFGHSWGGLYAQIFAVRHPERVLSLFLCSPSSGTGPQWTQTEREVLRFNRSRSTQWEWARLGLKSVLGMTGSDQAYRSMFKQVLENYSRPFDPGFRATDAMVENVRAEPINKTRVRVARCPALPEVVDHMYPVTITYGEQDIYGDSVQYVRRRFPRATVATIPRAGHLAWLHNEPAFTAVLRDAYRLPRQRSPDPEAARSA